MTNRYTRGARIKRHAGWKLERRIQVVSSKHYFSPPGHTEYHTRVIVGNPPYQHSIYTKGKIITVADAFPRRRKFYEKSTNPILASTACVVSFALISLTQRITNYLLLYAVFIMVMTSSNLNNEQDHRVKIFFSRLMHWISSNTEHSLCIQSH